MSGDFLSTFLSKRRSLANDTVAGGFAYVSFQFLMDEIGDINEDDNGRLLPTIGVGFRINVFPENYINIGLDAATSD